MNSITRQFARPFIRLTLLAMLLLSVSLTRVSPARAAEPAPAQQDRLYAVDNAGKGKSQLYTIAFAGFQVTPLGPQTNHDFEDVAISVGGHDLFASTGDELSKDKGNIYRVDGISGALTLLGASGFDRITIMKFRATDDTLWGWAEGKGLVQLDQNTGKGTLVFKSSKKFEGMAFQPDGKLYLATDEKLYVLDLAAKSLKKFASNLPEDTQSLASGGNGVLIGGFKAKSKISLFIYDIASKQVIREPIPLNSPFKSIVGLCVPSRQVI